jgi:bifunctional UDP-N-acetylglucosamine pyrophosphorylase / glucosamine-1-phosphate N-acetyltransferase
MKAIIMAGGKGTRLKSDLPKVLHPLMDKPLLKHVLDTLASLSEPPDETIVITGHQAQRVNTALAEWIYPFPVRTVHQAPQLGTGHALQQVLTLLPADTDCRVLILSGDVPLVRALTLEQLASQTDDLTLASAVLGNPTGYGRVLEQQYPDGHTGYLIAEEKDCPPELKKINLVNAGLYQAHWPKLAALLTQLRNDNAQGEYYLTDCVKLASDQALKVGVVALVDPAEMIGVNSRADLAECHQLLNRRLLSHWMAEGVTIIDPNSTWIGPDVQLGSDVTIYPNCWLSGLVSIGTGCQIGPNSSLSGQVTVGENTVITQSVIHNSHLGDNVLVGPFAHIRHNSLIASDVRIGNFVEVKQTNIASHTNAAHLAYLGDANIGQQVNVGAGTITANFDPIRNVKSPTHIHDGVKIGSNCVLVAPVTIGQNACIAAGSVITQNVAAGSLAIARERQREIDGWVGKSREREEQPV